MEKIIKYCKTKLRTFPEIVEKFSIPKKHERTLRRRLKMLGIELKDGRERIKF